MDIAFLGAEQPNLTRTLLENGATEVGLSYSGLLRRAGGKPKTTLAVRFPEDHKLLLDSGGYQANNSTKQRTRLAWQRYAKDYAEFVVENIERCTLVTEFDFLGLGPDWLEEMRRGVWADVHEEGKFLPVWHPEQGLASLEVTAERFGRLAVVGDVLSAPGQTTATHLIRLARRGIEVHGLALTKMELAESIPFTSIASSSWISPMKFGDAIVFDGRTLHRYPVKYSEQGRRRHRGWVEEHGLDVDKWMAGDKAEMIRVGIRSWLAWAASVSARHGAVVPSSAPEQGPGNVDDEQPEGETGRLIPLPVTRTTPRSRELVDLPLFGFKESEEDTEGAREMLPVLSDNSVRACDSCFLAPGHGPTASQGCPAYEPGAACAYRFPVRVETKGQRKAVWNGTIEMQFQRVAFMRMNEELTGGYADPNLSQEMDRLIKMMTAQAEVEDTRDYFEMTVRAKGKNQGVMSRLFGNQVGEEASRLDRPMSGNEVDRVIEGSFTRN